MLLPRHLFLGFLCFLSVDAEEPHSEGFSSTSLLDFPLSQLRGLDSADHEGEGYQEPDPMQEFLHSHQGSGFSSQETEETSILQSAQFFEDDEEGHLNRSSEGHAEVQTDNPTHATSYETIQEETRNRSSHTNENPDAPTSLWPIDSGEVPRQVSPDTRTIAEKGTMQPTTLKDEISPTPEHEWTISTLISAAPIQPTTKSSRKSKKHSASRNHHVNREVLPQPEHHVVSQGANPHVGHRAEGDGSMVPQDEEEEKMNPPMQSTLQDKGNAQRDVPTVVPLGSEQVICNDWINLAGKNYVILNMLDDIDCEQFRWQNGQQLLSLLEKALSWKAETPQKDWVISLSKPNENDNHLLMTITEEQRVVPIKDVFTALEDIERSLTEIGIQSYSTTVVCEPDPDLPRSDYGKLFIVLVIIGSICVMIIIAGNIYICWQRRLPKLKNMELHFVENGCHDNPTLDVAMDAQSEMQEKKPSVNGGTSHRVDGWQTLINSSGKEEAEVIEEDTHL
ncbi:podocalyxin-like protein 2 isoform X2 [Spea bombifrons]|uniref:podocalyxin-like protein 2 isoform X2 n=1 Tax=Spea bombifrons TaxID=233779 RepID=UPI0023494D99|nr:podocalyxin-like protein 2 isoform X2 [Spea bombifrons]